MIIIEGFQLMQATVRLKSLPAMYQTKLDAYIDTIVGPANVSAR